MRKESCKKGNQEEWASKPGKVAMHGVVMELPKQDKLETLMKREVNSSRCCLILKKLLDGTNYKAMLKPFKYVLPNNIQYILYMLSSL